MPPVIMTKNPEAADYGALPSSPSVDDETTNLIRKQAEEAIEMAKEAKHISRLSVSLLVGAATLFFAGYAFSSSNPNSKQLQSKVPFLGDWYKIDWPPLGSWQGPKEEIANFCSFGSFDIDSPDAASHPCARCYMLGVYWPEDKNIDVRHDVSYAEGSLDFAKCYYKGIKSQGREVTKADYTMKPFDKKINAWCGGSTVDFQNDYFRQNEHWTNPDEPILTEDGFDEYASYCFNDYFYLMREYCAVQWDNYPEDWT